MDSRSAPSTWHPRTLIQQAIHKPLSTFVGGLGTPLLLLILLDAEDSELALGLREQATRRSSLEKPSGSDRCTPSTLTFADRLPAGLLRRSCHVAPIQKSAGGSFLQHVSIGRARNHDIVLRHPSVSQFHGWFELRERGGLVVKDCDGRNHILVDKERVAQQHEMHPGQTVTFGEVECRVCTSASLWLALRG